MSDLQDYKSYLLRLWQAHGPTGIIWRASLEDSRTGLRLGFASITQLYTFLLDQTDDAQTPDDTRAARVAHPVWQGDDALISVDPLE